MNARTRWMSLIVLCVGMLMIVLDCIRPSSTFSDTVAL